MIGNRRNLSRNRSRRFGEESVNPMENLANLVDVMLVFACALMISLITYWNVDIRQNQINKEDLQPIDDPEQAIQNEIETNEFESKGTVYEDPETGDLYIVTY